MRGVICPLHVCLVYICQGSPGDTWLSGASVRPFPAHASVASQPGARLDWIKHISRYQTYHILNADREAGLT